ncbi:hypothetical protein ABFE25_19810 [Bacillus toyonensis]|uniref:hypothetical protein n=1 Tax=Bacillus toyonensis TaxID=155322 RepID=UPI003219D575
MMNQLKLNKQEHAVVIGTLVPLLGQDLVNERIDKQKLESAIPVFNAMEDNTTPKQRREAMISLLDKIMGAFLESKE